MPDPTAQNPPAAAHDAAQETLAAPGAGTDTPEAAEGESGRSLTWPEAIAEVREDTARIEARRAAATERDAALHEALQEDAEVDAMHRAEEATPEAHSGAEGLILGRAWMDADGNAYENSADTAIGPVRPVLLVPVEAGPVLEAALRWLVAEREYRSSLSGSGEAAPEPAGDGLGWDRDRIAELADWARPDDDGLPRYPALSPVDGDQIRGLLADRDLAVRHRDSLARRCAARFEEAEKLRAELAEATNLVEDAYRSMTEAQRQRDAARAELAQLRSSVDRVDQALETESDAGERLTARLGEVTAERDRYRQHSITLNSVLWRAAIALGEVPEGADQIPHDPTRVDRLAATLEAERASHRDEIANLAAEAERTLATARRDGAADALDDAARYVRRVFADSIDPEVVEVLGTLAFTIRSGMREIPTRQDGDTP